ncbi:hypothetical protein HXX76_008918 [Chlamydomonas incerta]|uniref:Uncharacterized protein n=1 Tax=Chlamydomonas incerta TaxID=51695 RepID=A0A835T2E0_CHLIN|nr:hypothetical protein HXX76_008918 [Chlamydomonas incerta]|eukprot:KAG2432574.1 hypothetical protein HXX76_008918 [Chlamydomonas incerta]
MTEQAAARRVLRGSGGLLSAEPGLGVALPTLASAARGEGVIERWRTQLVDELAKLGAGATGDLNVVFAGDLESRGLWQGLCATLGAAARLEIAEAPTGASAAPASCQVAGLVLEYVSASICGPLSASTRAVLAKATAVVLGVSARQSMHLGDAVPLRCPTSDPTVTVTSLVGALREAVSGANVPVVLLGPSALCPHRLPRELEAAVHGAQAADPATRVQMVAECSAALVARAVSDGGAGASAIGRQSGSAEEAQAVCAMSLLTANGVEEWNAQVAGAVQLLQDSWPRVGAAAPWVAFVDVHRLTKSQCAAAAPAPGAAAAPEAAAAQVFPTLTVPLLLEVVAKLGAQLADGAATRR